MAKRQGAARVLPEKEQFVKSLTEKLSRSRALILTDYRGMSVKEITEFRKRIRPHKGEYNVVKNRLFLRGLKEGNDKVQPYSEGPLALLTAEGDPYSVLKILYKFVKDTEKPKVKAGFLDKDFFEEGDLKKLSRLPSREELLAKVASGAQAPLAGFVFILNGFLQGFVNALNELKKKKEVESK